MTNAIDMELNATMAVEKREIHKGLREFVDFTQKNNLKCFGTEKFFYRCETPEQFSEVVKALGAFTKKAEGSELSAIKKFSDGIELEVYIARELTCKKIVKGAKVVPARPAVTYPATPERTEEIVEWECPESFFNLKSKEN